MQPLIPIRTNAGDWLQKYGDSWKSHLEAIGSRFGARIQEVLTPWEYPTDVPIVFVDKNAVLEVLRFLKTDLHYNFLSDLTATDEGGESRFHVVYNLYDRDSGPRIRVKVRLRDGESIDSAIPIWTGADWAEREVYDMYGITFNGHPNLRRILMDYRWEGYPLRKDYPLDGFQIFPDAEAPDPERLK